MNRTCFLFGLGLVCFVSLTRWVQAQAPFGEAFFQPAASLRAPGGGRGGVSLPMVPAETGKPFSAIAISRSEQIYLDGTHVIHIVTMMEYRDMEGRTRMEPAEPPEPVKQIMIRDPVAGIRYSLNIAGKTATKTAMNGVSGLPTVQTPFKDGVAPTGRGRGGGSGGAPPDSAEIQVYLQKLAEVQGAVRQGLTRTPNDTVGGSWDDDSQWGAGARHPNNDRGAKLVGAIGNDA